MFCFDQLYFFQKFKILIISDLEKNKPFLSSVRSFEEEVVQIIDNTMITVDKNITGPDKYLNSYSKYFYILTGEASLDLDKFFAVDPMPSLKVN